MLFVALYALLWTSAPKQGNSYWYSAQQRQSLVDIASTSRTSPKHYYVTIGGKKREYTECQHGTAAKPYGRWTDYKLLGRVAGQTCKTW